MLTTTEAQKRAGVSRPTLSRALKSGELRGMRDNSGRWLIEADDLDAWTKERSRVQDERVMNTVQERKEHKDFERLNAEIQALRTDLATAREAVARAEGEGVANRARIDDLAAERDRLLTMLESRNVDDLGNLDSRTRSRGFLRRLFGKIPNK